MKVSIKDRIAKSVFWIVWSRGGVQLLSGISTILVARLWLEPSDYGLMALVSVWTTTMGMIAEMGLGAAIIQFRDLAKEELNACFWLMALIGGSGYLVLFLFAPFIAEWFDNPLLSDLLRVAGLGLPLISLVIVPDSLLRQRLEFDKLAKIQLLAALTSVIIVISFAANGAGVWALISATLIHHVVVNIGLYKIEPWRPGFCIGTARLAKIIQYSLSTLGMRFCWTVYNQVDVIVLGKLTSEATLGFYSYAKELALLPVVRGSVVVNSLAFPVMAELQDDREAMRESFMRALRIVSCCFFPVCVGVALVAHDAVVAFLTEKWLPIVPMLQIFCVYGSLKSIDVLLPPVLLASYRHRFLLCYTAFLLIIMSAAFWVGALWYEGMGVVLAWVVVYPIVLLWLVREVLKEMSMTFLEFWLQIRSAVTATFLMVLVVLAAQTYLLPAEGSHSIVRLLLASGIGGLTYCGFLLIQGGKQVEEFGEVLRWIFLPKRTS